MYYQKVNTNLSQSLTSMETEKAARDDYAKCVLADPQIMAMILQYTIPELHDIPREEIMQGIFHTVVTLTVPELLAVKLQPLGTEDIDEHGAKIIYDIRSSVCIRGVTRTFLLNLEAQKSSLFSKLRYHLDNRITYYLCRMISSQKNMEFTHSNYDDIKPVYSIWVCMDARKDSESIIDIALQPVIRVGQPVRSFLFNLMHGVILNIRPQDAEPYPEHPLLAMLGLLFSHIPAPEKQRLLEEKYDLKMTTDLERCVKEMCNISDFYEEEILERGMERGMKRGQNMALISQVLKKIAKGKTSSDAADELETPLTVIQPIYTLAHTFPDANAAQLCERMEIQANS